jgi:glycosyltransferase involved in cell wall biosynthesis
MSAPPVRLLALVRKAPGLAPNQRFRHEQWAPILADRHGIELTFDPFESDELARILYQPGQRVRKARLILRDLLRRRSSKGRAKGFDAVVVLREASMVGGDWLERSIARAGIPLIYDFDDVIWRWGATGINGLVSLIRNPAKTSSICRLASAVTVGNEFLASYARRYNSNVHIVRTSIDFDRFPVLPQPAAESPFTIVWTGSHSTLACLETARPVIEAFGATRPVKLRVICDQPPRPFRNVATEFIRWTPANEATSLGAGHVGIMPLPDNIVTRGKCGCKALQYFAVGRPAIVSPIGINRRIVQPGENGFWATTQEEWMSALVALADDAALRCSMGAAGRATVEDGYGAADSAARFADVVRTVIGLPLPHPVARFEPARMTEALQAVSRPRIRLQR